MLPEPFIIVLCFRSSFLGLSSYRSDKYCGNIEPTRKVFNIDGSLHDMDYGSSPHGDRSYVEESGDQMDVWISLSPHTGSLTFVVTPFIKECGDGDAVYRQCPGSHSCVRRQLFCDRVVNCPHAWQESEETGCKFPHLRGGAFNNFPLSFLILFLILSMGSLIIIAWKVMWENSEKRKMALRKEEERLETLFQVKVKKKNKNDERKENPSLDVLFLRSKPRRQTSRMENNEQACNQQPSRQLPSRQISTESQQGRQLPRKLRSQLSNRLKGQKRLRRSQQSNRSIKRLPRSMLLRRLKSQRRSQRRSQEDRKLTEDKQSERYSNNECV